MPTADYGGCDDFVTHRTSFNPRGKVHVELDQVRVILKGFYEVHYELYCNLKNYELYYRLNHSIIYTITYTTVITLWVSSSSTAVHQY